MRTHRAAALTMTSALLAAGCAAGDVGPSESSDTIDETSAALAVTAPFGSPLPGLGAAELQRFDSGKDHFAEDEAVADGLGPVFNDTSCGNCHSGPALGGGSSRLVTRFGRVDANGVFDPLASLGGSLVQSQAITGVAGCTVFPETVPEVANVTTHRRTTALFGLGLVDAVPDSTFEALARAEARLADGAAGRVAHVANVATGGTSVGKFGWKAQVPSLLVFSGDAYLNEMGITNPLFPSENCPQGDCSVLAACDVKADPEDDGTDMVGFADFMTFLAAPPRKPLGIQGAQGALRFADFGCASCHTPILITGRNAVPALSQVIFAPFSDFLLHDMGSLGDGIVQGDASAHEMRTAPLWGVSAQPVFLHDGRAATLRDAILFHDGQGKKARDRFAAASAAAQAQLLAFLAAI